MVDLQPGQRVIYYTGPSLANARQTVAKRPDPQLAAADAAWEAALAGNVSLVQRRVEGGFQYLAIGRRSVDRAAVRPIMSEAPSFRRRSAA